MLSFIVIDNLTILIKTQESIQNTKRELKINYFLFTYLIITVVDITIENNTKHFNINKKKLTINKGKINSYQKNPIFCC